MTPSGAMGVVGRRPAARPLAGGPAPAPAAGRPGLVAPPAVLPMPPAGWRRFRVHTQYGDPTHPDAADVVAWLEWCRRGGPSCERPTTRSGPAPPHRTGAEIRLRQGAGVGSGDAAGARPQCDVRAAQRRVHPARRVPRAGREGRGPPRRRHAIRSARRCVARPLVVRLRYIVKVPYHRRTALSRRAVFARDEHSASTAAGTPTRSTTCCPAAEVATTAGRTWRRRAGRATFASATARRTRPACDWRSPGPPRELAWVVVAVGGVPDSWKPYLATRPSAGPRDDGPQGPMTGTLGIEVVARPPSSTAARWRRRRAGPCGG